MRMLSLVFLDAKGTLTVDQPREPKPFAQIILFCLYKNSEEVA